MDAFQQQAVILALRKMFKGGHFNICTVRSCIAVAGVQPPRQELDALAVLHCVDWGDMTTEYRDEVLSRTLALFAHEGADLSVLDVIGAPPDAQVRPLGSRFFGWPRRLAAP